MMVPNERRKFIMTVGTDIMKELESEEQGGCETGPDAWDDSEPAGGQIFPPAGRLMPGYRNVICCFCAKALR